MVRVRIPKVYRGQRACYGRWDPIRSCWSISWSFAIFNLVPYFERSARLPTLELRRTMDLYVLDCCPSTAHSNANAHVDVTLLAMFTCISTLGSISQQLHYATSWEKIKQAQYNKAVESLTNPSLGFGGAADITDVVLYWIQFYCYNVMSLMVLFWYVSLRHCHWQVLMVSLGPWLCSELRGDLQ